MGARIQLINGKEWAVDGTVDEVAAHMVGPDPFAVVDAGGRRVYIFRQHVVAVVGEGESAYQKRGVVDE